MTPLQQYVDDYPTCTRTYVTLCIYPHDSDVSRVSRVIQVPPTRIVVRSAQKPTIKAGWFLSSDGEVESRDLRRHLDWLVAKLSPHASGLQELRDTGSRTVVSCLWRSAHGHGGPIISVPGMRGLAELGLELEFDLYLADGN